MSQCHTLSQSYVTFALSRMDALSVKLEFGCVHVSSTHRLTHQCQHLQGRDGALVRQQTIPQHLSPRRDSRWTTDRCRILDPLDQRQSSQGACRAVHGGGHCVRCWLRCTTASLIPVFNVGARGFWSLSTIQIGSWRMKEITSLDQATRLYSSPHYMADESSSTPSAVWLLVRETGRDS